MSCRRLPQYHSDRGWILGVALTGTLTLIRSALRGFTRVRCCSTPPASSPRALTGSRSCSWLTVASNRPCRGLAPPIGHSCSTYARSFAGLRITAATRSSDRYPLNIFRNVGTRVGDVRGNAGKLELYYVCRLGFRPSNQHEGSFP